MVAYELKMIQVKLYIGYSLLCIIIMPILGHKINSVMVIVMLFQITGTDVTLLSLKILVLSATIEWFQL